MEKKLKDLLIETQGLLKFCEHQTINVPLSSIYSKTSSNKLNHLIYSIARYGMLSPIIVTKYQPLLNKQDSHNDHSVYKYKIITGHRRFLAAKKLNMLAVPVIIIDQYSSIMEQEIYLAENLNSSRFSLIDEAKCYDNLLNNGLSFLEISIIIDKTPNYIKNILRLLSLDDKTISKIQKIPITIIIKILEDIEDEEKYGQYKQLEKSINMLDEAINFAIKNIKVQNNMESAKIANNMIVKVNNIDIDNIIDEGGAKTSKNQEIVVSKLLCSTSSVFLKHQYCYQNSYSWRDNSNQKSIDFQQPNLTEEDKKEILELEVMVSENINEQVKIASNNDHTYNLSINNLTIEKLDHLITKLRKEVIEI